MKPIRDRLVTRTMNPLDRFHEELAFLAGDVERWLESHNPDEIKNMKLRLENCEQWSREDELVV